MAQDDSNNKSQNTIHNDSVNSCGKLRPIKESFNKLEALKPKALSQDQMPTKDQGNKATATTSQTQTTSVQNNNSGKTNK